jgi:hypothetical protein
VTPLFIIVIETLRVSPGHQYEFPRFDDTNFHLNCGIVVTAVRAGPLPQVNEGVTDIVPF